MDAASTIKNWQEWSASFDNILTQCATLLVFEYMFDAPFNTLIDSLFKVEINLNKFIVESKEIMDAKWTNATQYSQ